MATEKQGKPAPSHLGADEDFISVCIEDIPISQVARVLVKWLHEHPEKLHDSKYILTMEALKSGFPCETAKETNKTPTKPQ